MRARTHSSRFLDLIMCPLSLFFWGGNFGTSPFSIIAHFLLHSTFFGDNVEWFFFSSKIFIVRIFLYTCVVIKVVG